MKPVLIILAVIVAGVVLSILFRKKPEAMQHPESSKPGPIKISGTPDAPIGFGYKCVWVAVKTDNSQAVAEAIGLMDTKPCNWQSGIRAMYDYDGNAVFITPTIKGWVLAAGAHLPTYDGPNSPDRIGPFLAKLSAVFPEVQHFGTHRVVGYQAWTRVSDGKLVRSYVYLGERGEVLREVGEPDSTEVKLRHQKSENNAASITGSDSMFHPNEEDVMKMAAAWSIDPTTLEELGLPASAGIVGHLPK